MKILTLLIFCCLFFTACNTNDKKTATNSENNIDAARNFIRAALDGKFKEARGFMLQDSININFMDVAERSYQNNDQPTKDGYRGSSIRIYSPVTDLDDSTTIVVYSNSFKNDKDTLRVVKINNEWLVDFKYLYLHDADTLFKKKAITDTLQ